MQCPQVQIHPKPEFLRSNSSSGSPGLLLCELLTPEERYLNLTGFEETIAKILSACSRCTFENCMEYLLVLLGLPANSLGSKVTVSDDFEQQVLNIMLYWTKENGHDATLGHLTEHLRNHRSISEKIYDAIKVQMESKK